MSRRALIAAAACVLLSCNAVGFHEPSNVDFARYSTASVPPFSVSSSYEGADPVPQASEDAFVDELKRLGGFSSVESGTTGAELVISVNVTRVSIQQTGSPNCCNVAGFVLNALLDGECDDAQVSVDVELDMQATDASGAVVYSLHHATGSSDTYQCASDHDLHQAYGEALDDGLGEVAVFFLAGFDI